MSVFFVFFFSFSHYCSVQLSPECCRRCIQPCPSNSESTSLHINFEGDPGSWKLILSAVLRLTRFCLWHFYFLLRFVHLSVSALCYQVEGRQSSFVDNLIEESENRVVQSVTHQDVCRRLHWRNKIHAVKACFRQRAIFGKLVEISSQEVQLMLTYVVITVYLSRSWATCWPVPVSRIQKSLQRSTMIPSTSRGVVFHYPG